MLNRKRTIILWLIIYLLFSIFSCDSASKNSYQKNNSMETMKNKPSQNTENYKFVYEDSILIQTLYFSYIFESTANSKTEKKKDMIIYSSESQKTVYYKLVQFNKLKNSTDSITGQMQCSFETDVLGLSVNNESTEIYLCFEDKGELKNYIELDLLNDKFIEARFYSIKNREIQNKFKDLKLIREE